jgi:hypothetical protein
VSRLVGTAFSLIVFGAAGCAEKRPEVFPIKGQLFVSGKPAVGAVVFFHPVTQAVDSQNPATERRPTGKVEEDGSFELSTFGVKDGAPPGRYRVSVVWTKGEGDDATHLLPQKFMNPATSGLPIVEVRDEPTVLAPFKLSS